jgi:hypothetical protein
VKTVFLFSLVALPVLLITLATKRFGFTVFSTLAASVVGELLAFLLFASYNKWKVAKILSGEASGLVGYAAPDPRGRATAVLFLCALGIMIGLLAVSVHWIYSRTQSA